MKMAKRLFYLSEIYTNRPGSQTIHAFNRSLLKAGITAVRHHPSEYITNLARHCDDRGWGRNFFRLRGRAYIVAMMWPKTARLLPTGCWSEVIPFCFDCWPKDYHAWERIFRRYRVRTAFFTARQSAEYFQNRIPGMDSLWTPEAADPLEYDSEIPLIARTVDVLELGRRSELYHNAVTGPLEEKQYSHLYGHGAGRLFPTRRQLMDTWRQTKISVCFPKSLTAPERAGGVETVTFRYFESLASKCLIVGSCPQELRDLFGYNPVIEVDESDYGRQLLEILSDIGRYQEMVNTNYQRMLEVGSWDVRVQTMLPLLQQRGYLIETA
jgi:hypothetical protein